MKSQKAKVPPTFNDVLSTNNGKMTARRDGPILRYPFIEIRKVRKQYQSKLPKSVFHIQLILIKISSKIKKRNFPTIVLR